MDISIIVPVYNVEKFLIRCLDSIFNQQFSGTFEVVSVDDASTDHSLLLLKEYQKNEKRLVVLSHDLNKKISVARSTGLNAAKGDYIMNVDADDWLLPNALEALYQKCRKTGADVVVFDVIREDSEGNTTPVNLVKKELITTDKFKIQKLFLGSTCNKIVKREIMDDMISGKKGINSTEDLLYATEILLLAKTIYLTPEIFYVYFINIHSITHTSNHEQYLNNQCIVLEQLSKIVTKYNPDHELINNILSYLEKWILPQVCQLHFLHNKIYSNRNMLINQFRLFPEVSKKRIYLLSKSMINKYFCLIYCLIILGPRFVASVLWKSLLQRNAQLK